MISVPTTPPKAEGQPYMYLVGELSSYISTPTEISNMKWNARWQDPETLEQLYVVPADIIYFHYINVNPSASNQINHLTAIYVKPDSKSTYWGYNATYSLTTGQVQATGSLNIQLSSMTATITEINKTDTYYFEGGRNNWISVYAIRY